MGSAVAGNWRTKFTQALAASDALIVLLTNDALDSKYVVGEIGAARLMDQSRKMLLLPVRIENMGIPDFISDIYCFHLKTTDDDALGTLTEELHNAIHDNVKIGPRIFISHRHRDRPIAAALVALLEQAFGTAKSDIRCTSVPDYMLTPGERTSEQLRSDIAGAELVIGVLSPDTSDSNYVLCELGASWGRDVPTFPILVRGATFANIPSPLNERHSMSLEKQENCLRLIEYVASKTSLVPRKQTDQLAGELAQLAKQLSDEANSQVDIKSDWEHVHDATCTGPVWTLLQMVGGSGSVWHEITIRWDKAWYSAEVLLVPDQAVCLMYEKRNPDQLPIRVHVSPPCRVSFGTKELPAGASSRDISWRHWSTVHRPAG